MHEAGDECRMLSVEGSERGVRDLALISCRMCVGNWRWSRCGRKEDRSGAVVRDVAAVCPLLLI